MKYIISQAAILAFGLISLVLVLFSGQGNPVATFVMAVTFLICIFSYSYVVGSKGLKPTSFMVFMYLAFGLTLPGIYQLRVDQFYWFNNSVRRDLLSEAAFICFASVAAMTAGFALKASTSYQENRSSHVVPSTTPRNLRSHANIPFATLVISLASAVYIGVIFAKFGPILFFSTRGAASAFMESAGLSGAGVGITKTLTASVALASFVISGFVYYRLNYRGISTLVAVWISVISVSVACFPLAMPRFWMIALFMCVLLVYFPLFLSRHKGAIYASAPMVLFGLFPFLSQVNRHGDEVNLGFVAVNPFEYMLHGDFDGYQSFVNVLQLIEYEGLGLGSRLLSSLLFFVPRSIWPGKQEPTGAVAARVSGYSFENISMPIPAELYADGGIVLSLLGMFGIGYFIAYLDRSFETALQGRGTIEAGILAVLVSAFAAILFRGALLAVISSPAAAIALLYMWYGLRKVSLGRR